jgi:hypothetical protein
MKRYVSECEHTFNILKTERNDTPYKGKHYKHVKYTIVLASMATREKNVEIEVTIDELLCLRYANMKWNI